MYSCMFCLMKLTHLEACTIKCSQKFCICSTHHNTVKLQVIFTSFGNVYGLCSRYSVCSIWFSLQFMWDCSPYSSGQDRKSVQCWWQIPDTMPLKVTWFPASWITWISTQWKTALITSTNMTMAWGNCNENSSFHFESKSFLHLAFLYVISGKHFDGRMASDYLSLEMVFTSFSSNRMQELCVWVCPHTSYIETHNRTVNTQGKPGHGKPVDQHLGLLLPCAKVELLTPLNSKLKAIINT